MRILVRGGRQGRGSSVASRAGKRWAMRAASARRLIVAALAAWAGMAAARSDELFLPPDGHAPATVATAHGDGWERPVGINREPLELARQAAAQGGASHFVLNIAADVRLDAVVERTRRTPWGYSLGGRIDGGGAVTVVVHADAVSGTIWTPAGTWEFEPTADDHMLRRAPRQPLPGAPPVPVKPNAAWTDEPAREALNADDGTEVDVLVAYTPATLAAAETQSRLELGIDLAVTTTNEAFAASGVEFTVNLVGIFQVDYEESGEGGQDLDRVQDPDDGHMDDVHAQADALGADLVSLWVDEAAGIGGIAYLIATLNVGARVHGYSLVVYNQSAYQRSITFAHELGHNMGLAHDRHVARVPGVFGYSYGYVNREAFVDDAEDDACWYTIMAYRNRCSEGGFNGVVVPYFATPHRTYPEEADDETPAAPLGVPKSSDAADPDGPADAVLTLNRTRYAVANYRAQRTDDGNAQEDATPLGATSSVIGDLDDAEDVDFFRIEVTEAGTLRVGTLSSLDTRCTLLNEAGEAVAASDDLGPRGSELCEANVVPGVYFVRVEAGRGEPADATDPLEMTEPPGPYTLSSSFSPATEDDHGDTAAEATRVPVPGSIAGNLANATDADYFQFTLTEPAGVGVATTGDTDTYGTLTPLAAEDPPMRIGNPLTNDDDGPGANFVIQRKAGAGRYLVQVTSGGSIGDYMLETSLLDDDYGDSTATAASIAANGTLDGELELAHDRDYFRIEVPKPGVLSLTTAGEAQTDTTGALFAANGDALLTNDDGYEWPNFYLTTDAAPATYFLAVAGWDDPTSSHVATGPYTLLATFLAHDRAMALFPGDVGLRLGGAGAGQAGFARFINRSDVAGTVAIRGVDAAGASYIPVELALAAGQVLHFNSQSLADGTAAGLNTGLGLAEHDLHLSLETTLDLEALAYVRTEDGFVTTLHETAPRIGSAQRGQYRVGFFNPARNQAQRSLLRIVNPAPGNVAVEVVGTDDAGRAGEAAVKFALGGNSARVLTAQALETGGEAFGLAGRLGRGRGKWELRVSAFGPTAASDLAPASPLRVMSLLASPTGNVTNLSTMPAPATERIDVPLFIAADHARQQGFVRIINETTATGTVTIHAVDDAGERYGPAQLELAAGERIHFNSDHLENGNAGLGLAGIGDGSGNWRLELTTELTVTVLAYVRTEDGFVTSVHDLVPETTNGYEVVFFNPARNRNQQSWLRLVNRGTAAAAVTIDGMDDDGMAAGPVTLMVAPGTAENITAQALEEGHERLTGRLGAGSGKWRLNVRSDQPLAVLSLLESPTGNLTNLSTRTSLPEGAAQ